MAKKHPKTLCVINLKGGVGKSTISALLARYAFSNRRANVLAIDLDPQANLSQALMGSYGYSQFLRNQGMSVVEVFNGYRPPSAESPSPGPISASDVVHTVETSWTGDRSLQIIPSRFDFSDNLTNAIRPDPKLLARFLADNFSTHDLVIIDCAPTESILTKAAYHASGLVLVPVKPEFFATIGFPLLKQSLTQFRSQNRGHAIKVAGVVINNGFYDGGNDGGPEKAKAIFQIREDAEKNKWRIFENEIPFSRGFPKMMRGDYSYQGNAAQFDNFANEFFGSIGL